MCIKNTTVRELTFDYDFSLMKRDAGDVYIRMDYSNIGGYWDSVVDSNPDKRSLEERFWSTSDSSWGSKFQSLEIAAQKQRTSGSQLLNTFDENLLSVNKPCSLASSAFASIRASGSVSGIGLMGLSLLGTLSPTTQAPITFIEAYSFVKTSLNTDVNVEVSAKGEFQVPYTETTFIRSLTDSGYNHPGLISVTPTLMYDVAFTAAMSLEANFTTGTHAFTNTSILQAFPFDTQPMEGQTAQNIDLVTDTFDGEVFAASGDMFKLDFRLRMGLKIDMQQFGTSDVNFGAFAENSLDTYNAMVFNPSDSSCSVVQGTGPATGTVTYDYPGSIISAWDSNEDTDHLVGTAPGANILWTGVPGEESGRSGNGPPQHVIRNDTSSTLWTVVDGIQCPLGLNDSITVTCPTSLCILIPDLCIDDDSEGDDESTDDEAKFFPRTVRLDKRGSVRWFVVKLNDGNPTIFKIGSQPYPSRSQLHSGPQGSLVLNGTFDYIVRVDCANCDVIDSELSSDLSAFVTEHILELQTIARWIETAVTGVLPSGAMMTVRKVPASFFRNNWLANSLPSNIPNVGASFSSQVPNDRVFQTLGSNSNRVYFVLTAEDLNGVKAKIWAGENPMNPVLLDTRLAMALNTSLSQAIRNSHRETVLGVIRATRATFSYLNEDWQITERLLNTTADARAQIQLIESNIPAAAGLTATWDEYIQDQFETMQATATRFMNDAITTVRDAYTAASPPPADLDMVLTILESLEQKISSIGMPKPPTGPDDKMLESTGPIGFT